mmetsp:Transcript_4894/g.8702  ORF Transcript_4894/g.8702 Transcript_4894/m.8702 type:complete len:227 (-) Transcript_4894:462-1142(-)
MNSLLEPNSPMKSLTWSHTSIRTFLHSLVSEMMSSKFSFQVGTRDLLATVDSYLEEPATKRTNALHSPLQSLFTRPLASWRETYRTPMWALLCPAGISAPLTASFFPLSPSLPLLLLSPFLLFFFFSFFFFFSCLLFDFWSCFCCAPLLNPPFFAVSEIIDSMLSEELLAPSYEGIRLCGLMSAMFMLIPAESSRDALKLGMGVLSSSSTSAPSGSSPNETYWKST